MMGKPRSLQGRTPRYPALRIRHPGRHAPDGAIPQLTMEEVTPPDRPPHNTQRLAEDGCHLHQMATDLIRWLSCVSIVRECGYAHRILARPFAGCCMSLCWQLRTCPLDPAQPDNSLPHLGAGHLLQLFANLFVERKLPLRFAKSLASGSSRVSARHYPTSGQDGLG